MNQTIIQSALPRRVWIAAFMAAAITFVVYLPVINTSFYAEDPPDIGQIRYGDPLHIFTTNTSGLYYRPLTWLLLKTFQQPDATFDPAPFHIFHILVHAINVGLLCLLAWQLTGDGLLAILAAALLSFYPYSYDAVARTTPMQVTIIALLLISLLMYHHGRVTQHSRWLWLSLIPQAIGSLMLENALLFGLVVIALEALLVISRAVPQRSLFPIVQCLAAVPFVIIWLLIPKESSAIGAVFDGRVAALSINTALWPIPLIIDRIAQFFQSPLQISAVVTLVLGAACLSIVYWRSHRLSWLLLPIAFWIIGALPVWVVRNYRYVEISPRVYYVAVPGLALMWAGLVAVKFGLRRLDRVWRIGSIIIVSMIALQCFSGLSTMQNMYKQGSQLMNDIIAETRPTDNQHILFVDVPDRFVLKQGVWPFGWWGMLLAPVSTDLADYSDLTIGLKPETRSLSAPTISAAEQDAWPYDANTRGEIASPQELYADARWADAVYRTHFKPDGSLWLEPVGTIRPTAFPSATLASFGHAADLIGLSTITQPDQLRITLWWRSTSPLATDDTIFVHIENGSGLIAQADGDSLGELIPLEQWQIGDVIEDIRTLNISANFDLDHAKIGLGIYDRVSGVRLKAIDSNNAALPDNTFFTSLKNSQP